MARLTEKEKKNLSRNLKILTHESAEVRDMLCAYTGIKKRTFETYLYGERGASPKALALIADFFLTTPELLLTRNAIKGEMQLRNKLQLYYPIWFDRTTPKDEQILDIIRQNMGRRGKDGKILYSFLTLIGAADFGIRIRPEFTDEEVIAYAKATSGRDKNIYDIREEQYSLKYLDTYSKRIKGKMKKMFDELKSSPEYEKFLDLIVINERAAIELSVKQEQFIQKAENREYAEESLCDLPLTFIITQDKDNANFMQMENTDDSYYIIAEVPIADMIDIQDKFLYESFEGAEDFLTFILNELEPYKIQKAGD